MWGGAARRGRGRAAGERAARAERAARRAARRRRYAWTQTADVALGLMYGCACGAAAIGQMGGSTPLDPAEINRCMLTHAAEPSPRSSGKAGARDSPAEFRE